MSQTETYRGYPLVKHPSGIVGIFPIPTSLNANAPFNLYDRTVISTAQSLSEAKQIIDAWLDAP